MNILGGTIAVALAFCVLVPRHGYAQDLPMSDRQKAEIARQKAYEKATDQAYQAEMKRTRDVKAKAADPWANVRAPSTGSGN
jgi:hypothetical protein